jgi:hypothetical protein
MEAHVRAASQAYAPGFSSATPVAQASASPAPSLPSTVASSGHATGGPATLFAQLDSAALAGRTPPAGAARSLEVGLGEGGAGAVGVQARLAGGQISASIQVEREASLHALAHELPAIEHFLASSQVEVKQLSVDLGHGGSGHPPPGQPQGQPADGAGDASGQAPGSAPGHGQMGSGGQRESGGREAMPAPPVESAFAASAAASGWLDGGVRFSVEA